MSPQVEALPSPALLPRFRGRRVTFMFPVQVQSVGGGATAVHAHATNLSLGGMFVYSLTTPPLGSRVRIALEVRGKALLLAEAEVRWVRSHSLKSYPWCPGFGVRFVHLSPKAQALVHHLVTTASRRRARAIPEPVEQEGVPVPGPALPAITALDAPLDERDTGTKQMFPLPLAPAPREAPRPAFALEADSSWRAWRWLRWGLALAAIGAWVAAFANVRPSSAPRAPVARAPHPTGAAHEPRE